MKNIDKKTIIKFSIAVFALLLLITGATFAYFRLNTNIDDSSTNISSELEDPGTVALITGDNLYMDISYEDMRNIGYDQVYYASKNGKKTIETEEVIAYTQITGKNAYTCSYTLEITDESTNSIYNAFQNMDNKSEDQIILTINGIDYDFDTDNLFPLTINGTFENIWRGKTGEITAKLKLVNNSKVNQSGFAGTNINLAFNVTKFECEVNEKEYLANIVKENTTEYSSKNLVTFKESDYGSLNSVSYNIQGEIYNYETGESTPISDQKSSNFVYENNMWNLNVEVGEYSVDSSSELWVNIPNLSYTFDINTDGVNDYMVCFDTSNFYYNDFYINVDSLYSDDNGNDVISTMTIDSLSCKNLGVLSEGKHTIEVYFDYVYDDTSFAFNVKKFESSDSVGYRYSGNTPNNYVTFNGEKWRIIGVVPTCTSNGCTTKENLVKLVRDNYLKLPSGVSGSLSISYDAKASDYTGAWGNNTLYRLLNNYYYGAQNATGTEGCYSTSNTTASTCDYTTTNPGIKPSSFTGQMVKNVYWNTGASDTGIIANLIYDNETSNQTISGYVGLINPSDFAYAATEDYHNNIMGGGYYSNKNSNWLYGKSQCTITQYKTTPTNKLNFDAYGRLQYSAANTGCMVYPVVYLDKDVYITEGDGSSTNPYQIAI